MGQSLRTLVENKRGSLGLVKGAFTSLGGRCIFLSVNRKRELLKRDPESSEFGVPSGQMRLAWGWTSVPRAMLLAAVRPGAAGASWGPGQASGAWCNLRLPNDAFCVARRRPCSAVASLLAQKYTAVCEAAADASVSRKLSGLDLETL